MPEEKAKIRASILQKFVKHPEISYRSFRLTETKWAVMQYFGEKECGIVV